MTDVLFFPSLINNFKQDFYILLNSFHSNFYCLSSKGGTKNRNDKIKSNSASKKINKKREAEEDAEDSEEERWLDAIESGKLEEVRRLSKFENICIKFHFFFPSL